MFSAAAQLQSDPSTFFRQQLEYQEAGPGAGLGHAGCFPRAIINYLLSLSYLLSPPPSACCFPAEIFNNIDVDRSSRPAVITSPQLVSQGAAAEAREAILNLLETYILSLLRHTSTVPT